MTNRFSCINNKIELHWLNLSLNAFKMKGKTLFLSQLYLPTNQLNSLLTPFNLPENYYFDNVNLLTMKLKKFITKQDEFLN